MCVCHLCVCVPFVLHQSANSQIGLQLLRRKEETALEAGEKIERTHITILNMGFGDNSGLSFSPGTP